MIRLRMVDGVKIDVPNLSGGEWLANDLLDFFTYTNTNTGELKDGTLTARYNGLTFIITQSNKVPNLNYCSVRGSLHKYFNKGKTNANDFNIDQLKTVINDLSEKFSIDPETARLRNVEFGVNIRTSETAKTIINNLVAYNNNAFTDFKINGKKIGKGIGKQRYRLKVYDKGKQDGTNFTNILRLEIAVKKMHYLKKYCIETLNDLIKLEKVQPLGRLLLDHWQGAIYYDKQIEWKRLTNFERKKMLYYATPRNWVDFTLIQRKRAKKHFRSLVAQYGKTSTHIETANLIAEKWNVLTAEICTHLNHDLNRTGSKEMYPFEPLECTVKTGTKTTEPKNKKMSKKTPQNLPPISTHRNTTKKSNFCRTCAKDISHKKTNALYCSKKCNNSFQAKRRKIKRNDLKKSETENLNYLTLRLPYAELGFIVEYKHRNSFYSDTLLQSEISAPYQWVRKVTRVTVKDLNLTFTSYRAKKLIQMISKQNAKNIKK